MGPQWYYIAAAFAAIGTLLLGAYKLRPESTRIFVDSAKVTVELANKSRDELAEEVSGYRAEIRQLRTDMQARIDQLCRELDEERAEKVEVKRENGQLRARVQTLEDEVAHLKAEAKK